MRSNRSSRLCTRLKGKGSKMKGPKNDASVSLCLCARKVACLCARDGGRRSRNLILGEGIDIVRVSRHSALGIAGQIVIATLVIAPSADGELGEGVNGQPLSLRSALSLENRSARSVVDLACSYAFVLMQGRRLMFNTYMYTWRDPRSATRC
jgi:hypothetical protein